MSGTGKREPWLTGIVVTIILFMGTLITGTAILLNQDVNVVSEDYYEVDRHFEENRTRRERGIALEPPPRVEVLSSGQVRVEFPVEEMTDGPEGTLHLYRPSDRALDLMVPLDLQPDGQQVIQLGERPDGYWNWELEWTQAGIGYSLEGKLFIPTSVTPPGGK